jgi:hypothetical protein
MNKIVTINTQDKFKDSAISLNIPLPLDDKITDYNLIVQILKRGCKKYKSTKEAWEKLQDLYGAVFDIVTSKKGEMFVLTFYMQIIDSKFALEKEDLFEEAVELLSEYVNNPLIINGQFNNEYFTIEKENLKDYFEEFNEYEEQCRFIGCSHRNEPGCAVKEALKANKISKIRYENYNALYDELNNLKRY